MLIYEILKFYSRRVVVSFFSDVTTRSRRCSLKLSNNFRLCADVFHTLPSSTVNSKLCVFLWHSDNEFDLEVGQKKMLWS